MALPASGPISLGAIQTEFGGTNPISLSEYYSGGGRVPAGASGTNGAVPSSGAIQMSKFYGTSAFVPVYVQDVFKTSLYTGTSANQTVTNNIDLSTYGGMVWIKDRTTAYNHNVMDSARGFTTGKKIGTNLTLAQGNTTELADWSGYINAVSTTGFSIAKSGSGAVDWANMNKSGDNYVSWTFRKQPKFFDVVTWTGNNASSRTISHSLASTPGFILIKNLTTSEDWVAWHRNAANGWTGALNLTAEFTRSDNNCNGVTSTTFTTNKNSSPDQYVAYLFAHNAGGFGASGTDDVITCGITGPSGAATLGWEPQWLLYKNITNGYWYVIDTVRGWNSAGGATRLHPNTTSTDDSDNQPNLTSTGFGNYGSRLNEGSIYIAIRRA